ncbi:secreted protein [methanotrophic bacterial endosymbiont of Bathymodiolus sp.]|nr:secreted protein [methanotrophic bacterial endosymbiont of Bathymodiolus sp.]
MGGNMLMSKLLLISMAVIFLVGCSTANDSFLNPMGR